MEELVQFGIRYHAREAVELAFRNLPRRLHESMHGDARERAADANSTHAHCSEIAHCMAERATVEKFIEPVKQGPRASRVDQATVEYEDATGEFKEFGVKRSS